MRQTTEHRAHGQDQRHSMTFLLVSLVATCRIERSDRGGVSMMLVGTSGAETVAPPWFFAMPIGGQDGSLARLRDAPDELGRSVCGSCQLTAIMLGALDYVIRR